MFNIIDESAFVCPRSKSILRLFGLLIIFFPPHYSFFHIFSISCDVHRLQRTIRSFPRVHLKFFMAPPCRALLVASSTQPRALLAPSIRRSLLAPIKPILFKEESGRNDTTSEVI
jgi:hypothetical protein